MISIDVKEKSLTIVAIEQNYEIGSNIFAIAIKFMFPKNGPSKCLCAM